MPITTSPRIQTWRLKARFLVQSSGHLLIFQDIQERFTVLSPSGLAARMRFAAVG